jgi:hypothetical protein
MDPTSTCTPKESLADAVAAFVWAGEGPVGTADVAAHFGIHDSVAGDVLRELQADARVCLHSGGWTAVRGSPRWANVLR